MVLPETLIHNTGRIIPGQFAGLMGPRRDPWFIEASPFDPTGYGSYPAFDFDHQERKQPPNAKRFQAPSLGLPAGFSRTRLSGRMSLLNASTTSVPRSMLGRRTSRSTDIDRPPSRS